jgi:hypothetical protein
LACPTCECPGLSVRWLKWSTDRGPVATEFEREIEERLRKLLVWSPLSGTVTSAGDLKAKLSPEETKPDPSQKHAPPLTVLSCSGTSCVQTANGARPFEILNVSMWVRPVYVFVRAGGLPADGRVLRAASMPPTDGQVDVRKLGELLADVLGKTVVLEPLRNAKALMEEITASHGSQYGAVVLYGREPSLVIDNFLESFRHGPLPYLRVESVRAAADTPRTPNRLEESRRGFPYTFLNYPDDVFYRKLPVAKGDGGAALTLAVPGNLDGWTSARSALPLVLSDGGSTKEIPPRCQAAIRTAIRTAIGDAALAVAGHLGARSVAGPDVIMRDLLMYALLSFRGPKRPDLQLEEVLRGLAVAGDLEIRADSRAARSVQDAVGHRFSEAHSEIKDRAAQAGMPVRQVFSGSAPELMQRAKSKLYGSVPPDNVSLTAAWGELLAAVRGEPTPGRYKAGNGLTKDTNYNPYLHLAYSWAQRRPATRTAQLDEPAGRPDSEFQLAAVALAVELLPPAEGAPR